LKKRTDNSENHNFYPSYTSIILLSLYRGGCDYSVKILYINLPFCLWLVLHCDHYALFLWNNVW
jgi:hypothetical protein